MRHFRIPALILGGGVSARQDTRIVSQIDMAPTLLSLMGLDTVHPMLGVDLTRRDPNRAIMQFGDNFGYLKGDTLVVMEPHKAAHTYLYQAAPLGHDDKYKESPSEPGLIDEALAHALSPSWAYLNERYRLPAVQ